MTSERRARLRAAAATLLVAGLATASVVAAPIAASAVPMTFDVQNTSDSVAVVNSLRWAIDQANTNPGEDTITFHVPANSLILPLTALAITEGIIIDGVDSPTLKLDGGAAATTQVFLVAPSVAGGSFTFRNLTFDGTVGDPGFSGQAIYVTVGRQSAQNVTVDRVASNNLTSNEGALLDIFTMAPGGNVTVVDSTFANNVATVQGGSLAFRGINGTIAITRSTFTDNGSTTGDGGAIYVDGTGGGTPTVTVSSSTFTDSLANGPGGRGGAIFANFVAGFSVADSRFTGGSATGGGGAIGIFGVAAGASTVSIARSSFLGNQAQTSGGAIRFGPTTGVVSPGGITIDSSTFAANFLTAGSGHSIAFTSIDAFGAVGTLDAPVSVINSTFDEAGAAGAVPYAVHFETINGTSSVSVANSTVIGGIGVGLLDSTAVTLDHSILWLNTPGLDFGAAAFTGGSSVTVNWSLFAHAAGAYYAPGTGNQFSVPAHGLDPLANNGGPTQTRLPSATSPALDAGNPAFGAAPAFDQRGAGFARIAGIIDIGAAEVQAPAGPTLSNTGGTVSPGLPLGAAFLILSGLALLLYDYRRRYPMGAGA